MTKIKLKSAYKCEHCLRTLLDKRTARRRFCSISCRFMHWRMLRRIRHRK